MLGKQLGKRVLTASLASVMLLGGVLQGSLPVYASQISGPKKNTVEHLIILGDCEKDANGNPKYSLVADMYKAVKAEYSQDRTDYQTDDVSSADNTNDADGTDDTGMNLNTWYYQDNDGNGVPDWYDQASAQSDHGDNDGTSSTSSNFEGLNAYVKKKITDRYHKKWTVASEFKEQRTQNAMNKAIERYEDIISDIDALDVDESKKLAGIHALKINWENGSYDTELDQSEALSQLPELSDILDKHKVDPAYEDYEAKKEHAETLFSDFTMPKDKNGNSITGEDMVLKKLKEYNASALAQGDNDHDGKPDTKTAIVIYYGLEQINDLTAVRHDEDTNTGKYHKWKYHPAYFEHDHDMKCRGHLHESSGTGHWEGGYDTVQTGTDEDGNPTYEEVYDGNHMWYHDSTRENALICDNHDEVDCTHYHEAYWECIPIFQHQSNIVDHSSAPEQYDIDLSAAAQKWQDEGALIYWVGMLPGYGYDKKDYGKDPDSYGYWQDKFNNMLQSNLPTGVSYLDINNAVIEKKPYFEMTDTEYQYGYDPRENGGTAWFGDGNLYWNWKNQMYQGYDVSTGQVSGYNLNMTKVTLDGTSSELNEKAQKAWLIEEGESASEAESNSTSTGKSNPYNRWDGDTGHDDESVIRDEEDAARAGKPNGNKNSTVAETDSVISQDEKNFIHGFVDDGKTSMEKSHVAHSDVYTAKTELGPEYQCKGCNWTPFQQPEGDAISSHDHSLGGSYTDSAGNDHTEGYWDEEGLTRLLDPHPTMIRSKIDDETLAEDGSKKKKYAPDAFVFTRKVVKSDHTIVDESELTGGKDIYHSADDGSQGMGAADTINLKIKNQDYIENRDSENAQKTDGTKTLHEVMSAFNSNWVSKNKDNMQVNFSDTDATYEDEDYKYEYGPSKEQLENEHVMTMKWKYDQNTLQYIYHIILNSIYVKNEKAKTAEAIDTNFYSVSCALTSWINGVLGKNSSSESGSSSESDSTDSEADLGTTGNAGAVLGYGDKDFNFAPFLASASSKSSTGVSYKALEKNGDDTAKELAYARYGHLLGDLGIDQYGMKTTVSGGRLIPGAVLTVLFTGSLFAGKALNFMIKALQFINPFQFLTKIDNSRWQGNLSGTNDFLTGQTKDGGQMPAGISNLLTNTLSVLYDTLTGISWAIVVPLMFAIMFFLIFVWNRTRESEAKHRGESRQLIKTTLFRVIFIAIGIPLLGALYTSVLTAMSEVTADVHSPAAETVVSSFVDFGAWAKNNRLDPAGTLTYDNTEESSSPESVRELRRTAYAINQKSGAVNGDISSVFSGDATTMQWEKNNLTSTGESADLNQSVINDAYRLLSDYTQDNFYYPSDWESDVMGVLQNRGADAGRRQGAVEDGTSFKKDEAQGEDTVYNMFEETSTADKWSGRSAEDNSSIFASDGGKWSGFNIFNNGAEIASVTGSSTKYSSTSNTKNGTDIDEKTGLSTMSMYNYLSSRFADDGVVTYSNKQASSLQSKLSHHAVNLLGGGAFRVLYFLNTAAMLLVTAIIGIGYALGTIVNAFRRGIKVMASIPGAALGVMKSIVTVITTVIMMIVETIGTIFTYIVVTQLLLVLGEVLTGMAGELADETASVMIGGRLADIAGMLSRTACMSMTAAYGCTLAVLAGVLFFVSAVLAKYRRAYMLGQEYLMERLENAVILEDVRAIIKERDEGPANTALLYPGVLDYLSGRTGAVEAV